MPSKLLRHWILLLVFISSGFSQQYNESNDFSYALKLFNEAFYDIAAKQFGTFINRYPNSERIVDAKYYYGDALSKIGEPENARIEFQALAVSYPDHARAPQAWQRVGDCYVELGKPEEAAKAYETIKILFPNDSRAPLGLLQAAELFMQAENLTKSRQVLHDFLDRYLESSEYPRGRLLMGQLLLRQGDLERAGNEFKNIAVISSDASILSEAQLGEARVARKLGLSAKATEILQGLTAQSAGTDVAFEAILELSELYRSQANYAASLSLLNAQIDRFANAGQKAALKISRIQTLFVQEDYRLARRELSLLGESGVSSQQAKLKTFYLACCDYEMGNVDAAVSALSAPDFLDANGQHNEIGGAANFVLCNAQLAQGNIAAAQTTLQKFQSLNLGDFHSERLHSVFINTAIERGNLTLAEEELQRYRGLYPASASRDELIFRLGEAFYQGRQYERSQIYFDQLAQNYRSSGIWPLAQQRLRVLGSLDNNSETGAANELARLVGRMLMGEDRRQMLLDLGRVHLHELKNFDEAVRIFKHYISEAQDSTQVANGLYYLSQAELLRYETGEPESKDAESHETVVTTLRKAMEYIRYSPSADSLTFWFLTVTAAGTNIPLDRQLGYWQRFEANYPGSNLLPEGQLRIANIARQLGDTTVAISYFRKLQNSASQQISGDAAIAMAEIQQQSGKAADAIETLKAFLLKGSNHPEEAMAHARLATLNKAIGDHSTAAQFLERLIEHYDYSEYAERAPLQIAELYTESGESARALTYLEEYADSRPTQDPVVAKYLISPSAENFFYLGKARFYQGDMVAARQDLLYYLQIDATPTHGNEALYLLGSVAVNERDFESALVQFALLSPDEDEHYYREGMKKAASVLYDANRFDEALKKYNALISLPGRDDDKIFIEGQKIRAMIHAGQSSAAAISTFKSNFDKHEQRDEYLASFEMEQGIAAYNKKRFDPALKHFNRVKGKYKKTTYADDGQYYLARTYATLNKGDDAKKELEKLFKDFPRSEWIGNGYLLQAEVFLLGNDTENGLAAAEKAADLASNDDTKKSALGLLINTYENLGLWDGALQRTREYIERFPESKDIIDRRIAIGIHMARLHRYSEAVDYLSKLKYEVSSEQEPEIQFYIGEAYFNAGNYETAINELVKIPLLSRQTKLQWEASALYFAGQAYEKLGRQSDAKRMYQEIVDRPGIQIDFKREARKLIDKLERIN